MVSFMEDAMALSIDDAMEVPINVDHLVFAVGLSHYIILYKV